MFGRFHSSTTRPASRDCASACLAISSRMLDKERVGFQPKLGPCTCGIHHHPGDIKRARARVPLRADMGRTDWSHQAVN